nr:MAG TPA: hypothetical protein [Caudoviricetes sp.]
MSGILYTIQVPILMWRKAFLLGQRVLPQTSTLQTLETFSSLLPMKWHWEIGRPVDMHGNLETLSRFRHRFRQWDGKDFGTGKLTFSRAKEEAKRVRQIT